MQTFKKEDTPKLETQIKPYLDQLGPKKLESLYLRAYDNLLLNCSEEEAVEVGMFLAVIRKTTLVGAA